MAIPYGVVKDNVIELPSDVELADGLMVDVRVPDTEVEQTQADLAEEQFKQQLLEAGMLTEIKRPARTPSTLDRTPIEVKGTPLSQTIIEERR